MSQYVSDLQDLAQQWGIKFSELYDTTCRWIDLHATKPEMVQYKQYKIGAKVTNVRYEGSGTAIDMPVIVILQVCRKKNKLTRNHKLYMDHERSHQLA